MKKMKIAIAAAAAPISGRVNRREASDRFGAADSAAFAGGVDVSGVVAGELMICSKRGGAPGRSGAPRGGAGPEGPAAYERQPAHPGDGRSSRRGSVAWCSVAPQDGR